MQFECVWCHRPIEVERAGWAYIHSVALLHLHSCFARPVNITPETIEATAERLTHAALLIRSDEREEDRERERGEQWG